MEKLVAVTYAFNSVKVRSLTLCLTDLLSVHCTLDLFIGCPLSPHFLLSSPRLSLWLFVWSRCSRCNSIGGKEKGYLSTEALLIRFVLLSFSCLCMYSKCKRVEEQWHCKLMQRDEAKFSPWNIYQCRLGSDFSLTFTNSHFHKGHRGDVAAACVLNDVFWSSNSLFCLHNVFFANDLSGQRKCNSKRGRDTEMHSENAQLNFCCFTVMWASTMLDWREQLIIVLALTSVFTVPVSKTLR